LNFPISEPPESYGDINGKFLFAIAAAIVSMCRQDSHVRMSAEEEIAAEESLSIYCKPVELYNILQRRAIRNVVPPKSFQFSLLFVSISVCTLVAEHTFFFFCCFCSHIFFKDVCATKQKQSIKGGTSLSNLKFIFYAYSDANIFLSVVPFI